MGQSDRKELMSSYERAALLLQASTMKADFLRKHAPMSGCNCLSPSLAFSFCSVTHTLPLPVVLLKQSKPRTRNLLQETTTIDFLKCTLNVLCWKQLPHRIKAMSKSTPMHVGKGCMQADKPYQWSFTVFP